MRQPMIAALFCACLPAALSAQMLTLDIPQTGSLEPGDPRDRYGAPGDVYTFRTESGIVYALTLSAPAFDALLALEDDAGNPIGSVTDDSLWKISADDNGLDSTALVSTPMAATIRIRATSVSRGAQGGYTLSVKSNGPCEKSDSPIRDWWGCPKWVSVPPTAAEAEASRNAAIAQARAALAKDEGWAYAALSPLETDPVRRTAMVEQAVAKNYWPAILQLANAQGNDPATSARVLQALNRGVDIGLAAAMQRLARIYENGLRGQAEDPDRARKFYELAAMRPFGRPADDPSQTSNNLNAARESAVLLAEAYAAPGQEVLDQRIENKYDMAARRKLEDEKRLARRALALNITANPASAAKWRLVAARLGDPGSAMDYAFRLRNADGVAQDRDESARWLRKAAVRKYQPAIDEVERMVTAGAFK